MWALAPLIVVVGLFFVLFVLPQRRQMNAVASMQARLEVGDEIITTSGIYGRITAMDAETVDLEVAPGAVIKLVRRAIGRRVADLVPPPQPSDREPDQESDAS